MISFCKIEMIKPYMHEKQNIWNLLFSQGTHKHWNNIHAGDYGQSVVSAIFTTLFNLINLFAILCDTFTLFDDDKQNSLIHADYYLKLEKKYI